MERFTVKIQLKNSDLLIGTEEQSENVAPSVHSANLVQIFDPVMGVIWRYIHTELSDCLSQLL